MKTKDLLKSFRNGDLRALSRLVSMAENKDPAVLEILKEVVSFKQKAKVIGITGPPGAGKSSLMNNFVHWARAKGKRVAIIAVDPVSPFSGGSLLGDRIRLAEHFNDEGVFIRSLSSRGKLGGLSLATREVISLCEEFGFDYVMIETVGVGQSEVDVSKTADVTLLVLTPEWGDSIQAIKAGVLEVADAYVVNKSDREGSERVANEIRGLLQMMGRSEEDLFVMTALQPETTTKLWDSLDEIFADCAEKIKQRREQARIETFSGLLVDRLGEEISNWVLHSIGEIKNPYGTFLDFQKQYPPGSILKP